MTAQGISHPKMRRLEYVSFQGKDMLDNIKVPSELQNIKLILGDEIPLWVELNKKDNPQTDMLYGLVHDRENTLISTQNLYYTGTLGECSCFIALVKNLPRSIAELYGLSKPEI